jgi:hypothetical protein
VEALENKPKENIRQNPAFPEKAKLYKCIPEVGDKLSYVLVANSAVN